MMDIDDAEVMKQTENRNDFRKSMLDEEAKIQGAAVRKRLDYLESDLTGSCTISSPRKVVEWLL